MGLEGEQGKYKDIGALSKRRSDGAENLPLVAAVDDMLKAPAAPQRPPRPRPAAPEQAAAKAPAAPAKTIDAPARATPDTQHVPGAGSRAKAPPSAPPAAAAPASGTGLGRIFQRQAVAPADKPPQEGTPLRTLFDRLR